MATEKRIVATGFAVVGTTGQPSSTLAAGEYIVFQKGNAAHEAIAREIATGRKANVGIQEVDLGEEAAAEEARTLSETDVAEEQARQLEDRVRKAQIKAGEGVFNPEENTVADVLAYLKQATPEEVRRVQTLEAASERKSKQVADFEAKE
jgi:hypothetical protein